MINFDWQSVAVVLVIGVAGGYLARAAWHTVARRKAGACGGCAACPSSAKSDEPIVIGVRQLAETAPSDATHQNGVPRA